LGPAGGGNPGAPDPGAGSRSRRETRAGPKGGAPPPPPTTDKHEPRGEREERGEDPEWEKRERESESEHGKCRRTKPETEIDDMGVRAYDSGA